MDAIWQEIHQLLSRGEDFVVATIVQHSGSTPRTSGSKMIVRRDGQTVGSIGGGPVEAEVTETARAVFAEKGPVLKTYDFNTSASAAAMDLICGGRFVMLIEHFAADHDTREIIGTLTDLVDRGKEAVRLCRLVGSTESSNFTIENAVIDIGGQWQGTLQPSEELQERIVEERKGAQATTLFDHDGQQYLIEVIIPLKTVYILGAGHVAKEIAPLLYKASFRTVVIDDRAEFANTTRFPEADRVMVSSGYLRVFADFRPDANSYIIIVTRGHRYDKECLGQALRSEAGYIGMIGSRKKREQIYRSLEEEGFSTGDLERVHCPIGLPIGGESPFEIAVSIVAEIIQHRAQNGV